MSTFCLKTRAFFFYCYQHLTAVRASFLFSSAFSSIVMLGTKQVQTKQVCLLHGLFPFSVDASFLLLFIPSHENFLICLCNANHTPKITYNLYPILNTAYSEKMPVIMMLQNLDRLERKKTSKTENLEIKVLSGKVQSKNSKKTGSFMLHLEGSLANQVNPFHITAVALEAWTPVRSWTWWLSYYTYTNISIPDWVPHYPPPIKQFAERILALTSPEEEPKALRGKLWNLFLSWFTLKWSRPFYWKRLKVLKLP